MYICVYIFVHEYACMCVNVHKCKVKFAQQLNSTTQNHWWERNCCIYYTRRLCFWFRFGYIFLVASRLLLLFVNKLIFQRYQIGFCLPIKNNKRIVLAVVIYLQI